MAHLTEDELDEMVSRAVQRERERCARLLELAAEHYRLEADQVRKEGETPFYLFVPDALIPSKQVALNVEAAAQGLTIIARAIRDGYEPDQPDPVALYHQTLHPEQRHELEQMIHCLGLSNV